MTKLMEWLFGGALFLGPWTAIVTGTVSSSLTSQYHEIILYLPIVLLFLFAIWAATVVLYRTFTFNNCEEAAESLKLEIKQAQAELRIKGILPRDPKGSDLM
ncbi:hypothetical protein HCN44_003219 [Aphidius gifuensis]|uniref:Dolichol-phosphate mannosyltransferase subunit 3 n=1 Tax=Aphidius gifuensis TaxID=684658 RepID=A0A834XKM1_APHGI|nr:dolichol-phosphate mannosyltransferase subunit 3 [Aphidius gifuensis]KAF7987457.1 hypothetical protein HCN44_003219 [Aphidius gifuensis]